MGGESWGNVRSEGEGNGTEVLEVFDPRQRGSRMDKAGVAHRVDDEVGVSNVSLTEEESDDARGFAAELGGGECR